MLPGVQGCPSPTQDSSNHLPTDLFPLANIQSTAIPQALEEGGSGVRSGERTLGQENEKQNKPQAGEAHGLCQAGLMHAAPTCATLRRGAGWGDRT